MLSKNIVTVVLFLLLAPLSFGSELIVKLSVSPDTFLSNHPEVLRLEPLVEDLNLYLAISAERTPLSFDDKSRSNGVEYTMANEVVKLRSIPNDPIFSKQWALQQPGTWNKGIDAEDAWSITTGGINILGQDIVVAVIDGGVDTVHRDLAANIWTNANEVPGNGIDDDGNGYIDDVHGWDSVKNNGQIPVSPHGTHVAGTIGAIGNNNVDVTGVNWNTKIMVINNMSGLSSSSGLVASVLKSYNYIIKQKKLWIETQGEKGANIVVTNSSFGIDRANCQSSRYKAWNEAYDLMGELGILSAVATANRSYDVDKVGDVPTGCDSEYIIAVTNTNKRDRLSYGSAWGKRTIDLGAPGDKIHSTFPGNTTKSISGTSMSTPHVAGAIALMHSGASTNFAISFNDNPGLAALELKKVLLNTTRPISALKNKSTTGGRLDLGAAVSSINAW